MEKFTVPQFIENEDRILWFLSVRQFIIILVAGGIMFLLYQFSSTPIFIIGSILVGTAAGIIAFYKVNGQPFHFFLLNVAQTTRRPNLRIWKKEATQQEWEAERKAYESQLAREEKERLEALPPEKQGVSPQRLSEISLIVDTGGAYQGEAGKDTELFK